ncbi:acyl-CoA carboxylase subunit epsilon [Streptomyces sp. Tu 3180]|uniref:acyl-CoA carboxylase subunit epsilon n=1 Tax=Streptomyces sp. Tu 3180 TaxID=2682611 RepID=UPI0013571B07|nr:acyl-CoA carboxylase subunit epsilon [Streptomyces sp. Tu 3180]KAF3468783.1 acyl-CoA carboxylase subunit epsilon [Streptomyces sp. Tu 3180]
MTEHPAPEFRIVRGRPTPEEIAATAAVLCLLLRGGPPDGTGPAPAGPAPAGPGWLRPLPHVPAGAWRTVG